jgi:hypothetical protein
VEETMPDKAKHIIGYLRSGKPVYQMAGGDGTDDKPDGDGAKDGKPPEPKVVTMRQEELDAIVEGRLARERAKFADYDELKRKATEAENASKTETEKLAAERDAAKAEGKTAIATAQAILRRAEIKVEAMAAGAVDPADIVRFLADDDTIVVTKDGEVQGAKLAVKRLLDEKPYLKGEKTSGVPNTSGGEHKGADTASLDEQIAAAEKAGNWRESMRLKSEKAARTT